MPELRFQVRWPDGRLQHCYSPSTIIKEYLQPGRNYTVPDFLDRCQRGLHAASERVRARYGSGCSRAMAQLASIEADVKRQGPSAGPVRVEGFEG